MVNQYIKVGINVRYLNINYSHILEYIGRKYKNEINGTNSYKHKGSKKIVQTIKNEYVNTNVTTNQVKALCRSFEIFSIKKHLKIPRDNTILILKAIIFLIKNDEYAIKMFEKYCNDNNINEINRVYRTVLIPKHYDELKNNIIQGKLKSDNDAVNIYENLKSFIEKYKE